MTSRLTYPKFRAASCLACQVLLCWNYLMRCQNKKVWFEILQFVSPAIKARGSYIFSRPRDYILIIFKREPHTKALKFMQIWIERRFTGLASMTILSMNIHPLNMFNISGLQAGGSSFFCITINFLMSQSLFHYDIKKIIMMQKLKSSRPTADLKLHWTCGQGNYIPDYQLYRWGGITSNRLHDVP